MSNRSGEQSDPQITIQPSESEKLVDQEPLSASLEDYIEAIGELTEDHGHAHTRDIATRLNVKMPSVTNALWSLSKSGYIEYQPNHPVILTKMGVEVAARIMRRHRTLKRFFGEILCLTKEDSDSMACRIEHIIDSRTTERLGIFMNALTSRLDAFQLKTYLEEAYDLQLVQNRNDCCTLSELAPGQRATVEKYGKNLTDAPRFLGQVAGLVVECLPDAPPYTYLVEGQARTLTRKEAENIWVKR